MASRRAFQLLLRSTACLSSNVSFAPAAQAATQPVFGLFTSTIGSSNATLFRSFTNSAPSFSRLAKTLRDEAQHEVKNYEKPEIVAAGPPAPFNLEEKPGDTHVVLKRKYNNEDVEIHAKVNDQPPADYEDEGGDEGSANSVVFNVTVVKGDKALVFECMSDGSALEVEHVSFEPKEGHSSDTMYHGPVYQELDETLQEEFKKFLEERGVTEEVGEYLRHLLYDKEQREYTQWLKDVQAFVEK